MNILQNAMLDYMAQTAKDFATITVKNLGYVKKSRGNVMVDVKRDGKTFNVIKVRIKIMKQQFAKCLSTFSNILFTFRV